MRPKVTKSGSHLSSFTISQACTAQYVGQPCWVAIQAWKSLMASNDQKWDYCLQQTRDVILTFLQSTMAVRQTIINVDF
jgi:hypothetical protein